MLLNDFSLGAFSQTQNMSVKKSTNWQKQEKLGNVLLLKWIS